MDQEKFTQQVIMKRFMKALDDDQTSKDGHTLIDNAIYKASSGTNHEFKNWKDVATYFLKDLNESDSVEYFLRNVCGFIPYNEDTGSITGFDVGSGKVKTKESIVPEDGEAKDLVPLYKAYIANGGKGKVSEDDPTLEIDTGLLGLGSKTLSFTKRGLTLIVENYDQLVIDADAALAKAEDARSTQDRYAISKINTINGLYTWWLEGALDLIEESYGTNLSFDSSASTDIHQIKLTFFEGSKTKPKARTDIAAVVTNMSSSNGITNELTLEINLEEFGNINLSSNKNGISFLDAELAHEFTHGTMAANINYFMYLPRMIMEGTAEFTKGADNGRFYAIEQLTKAYKTVSSKSAQAQTKLARILNSEKAVYYEGFLEELSEFQGEDGISEIAAYAIGYSLMRYFAKKCATPNEISAKYIGNLTGFVTSEKGELLRANNGTVALQKGDAIGLDSSGNIIAIQEQVTIL